ncbi:MAG: D-glycero-beta-D-manno-heptose 1-phosphate adenylyltransferase, partial [Cytophagaceae bacterium]
ATAQAVLSAAQAKGERVVMTNGCFDLLHAGHVRYLQAAKALGERLVVGLNTDQSVRQLKGPTRPVQSETARARVAGAIRSVSAVTIFDEDTPLELISALKPDILVKGADYTEDQVVGGDIVKGRGGRILLVQLEEGHSTSRLVSIASTG